MNWKYPIIFTPTVQRGELFMRRTHSLLAIAEFAVLQEELS